MIITMLILILFYLIYENIAVVMKVVLAVIILHMFIGAITGMNHIIKKSFRYNSSHNTIRNLFKKTLLYCGLVFPLKSRKNYNEFL
jgi:hypothetical protein